MHGRRQFSTVKIVVISTLALVQWGSVLARGGGPPHQAEAPAAFRWVVVVRHAEKAAEPAEDPPLTPEGEERAEALRWLLRASPITGLFGTNTKRSELTLAPLAEEVGLLVVLHERDDPYGLADRVLRDGGTFAVVAAHSDTVLPIISGLTGGDYSDWGPVLYHDIFLVGLPLAGDPQVLRFQYGEPHD